MAVGIKKASGNSQRHSPFSWQSGPRPGIPKARPVPFSETTYALSSLHVNIIASQVLWLIPSSTLNPTIKDVLDSYCLTGMLWLREVK